MCNGECGDHQLLRKPCVERRAIEWFAGHAPSDLGEISGGAWRPGVCAYTRQGNCQFDKKTAHAQRNSAERCVVWLSSQFAARLASRGGTTIELKLCSVGRRRAKPISTEAAERELAAANAAAKLKSDTTNKKRTPMGNLGKRVAKRRISP
jgi:hypothetical protein